MPLSRCTSLCTGKTSSPAWRSALETHSAEEGTKVAFIELRQLVRLGINWMTICYAREFAATRQAKKQTQNDPVNLLARARKQFEAAAEEMPNEQRSQILQAIDLATRTVKEQQQELI